MEKLKTAKKRAREKGILGTDIINKLMENRLDSLKEQYDVECKLVKLQSHTGHLIKQI